MSNNEEWVQVQSANTGGKVERLEVPGGWLYRNSAYRDGGMTFVPTPTICGPNCLRLHSSVKPNSGRVQ